MALIVGALGIVFGDIGTRPLYALEECFSPASAHHLPPTPENVLGILSLVFWALALVVGVKYLGFVLRADNQGAGGILALVSLAPRRLLASESAWLVLIALFGAALLVGEGVITPAISVLSALEGIAVAAPVARPLVVPLTCVALAILFWAQRRDTRSATKVLGPVVLAWLLTVAVLGGVHVAARPAVLDALDPRHAVAFFGRHGLRGVVLLGDVALVITGVEALYADMGLFGRGPLRATWALFVGPALLLGYFGQGALLLADPSAASNPFYAQVPRWAMAPVIVLALAATIAASQALIWRVFSLVQQAVQLGYFPRVTVARTPLQDEGLLYLPAINPILAVARRALVVGFRSATALAAAYGLAVTGSMTITSVVFYVVVTRAWRWSRWKAAPLLAAFLAVDLALLAGSAAKIVHGGWVSIVLGTALFTVMKTWHDGRRELGAVIRETLLPLPEFLDDIAHIQPVRVRGTAVFLASNAEGTPQALVHHFLHNRVLHDQVIILSVAARQVPEIPRERRLRVEHLGQGFHRVLAQYGFMQQPDVPRVLEQSFDHGLAVDLERTSYYLGRETLLPTGRSRMSRWRKILFAFLSRNARPATAYFHLPPDRVVELGMQVDL